MNVGAGASKVKVYGPGVEPNKVKAHEPTHFTIDCREAGKGIVMGSIPAPAHYLIVFFSVRVFSVRELICVILS